MGRRWLALLSVAVCVLGACSGTGESEGRVAPNAVDALRRRPLNLPSVADGQCPASTQVSQPTPALGKMLGDRLVRPVFGSATGTTMRFGEAKKFGSAYWGGDKVLWAIDPAIQSEALVRGHQLDGPSEVRFFLGGVEAYEHDPLPELVIDHDTAPAQTDTAWRHVVTSTAVQEPGCYAVQIDTRDRSEILVFQVA